ncbi:hypothetical protein VP1G_02125 [Cytospora mali]|uniref:Helicase C-terminal domain-containing protein n=1 Tax=Cytospora mali TaxID=578113 RepID=A0A194USU0_CYTMA|nr:hypothetical protein VP1G_02125 [Valsa mali var. pyri (nom. inval.)]
MSQNPAENAGNYLKLPVNFNVVKAFVAPPVELDTATDIRLNKYVLSSNLRFVKIYGQPLGPDAVKDEDWVVELFGDMDQFLIDDKNGIKKPCDFVQFYRRILYDLHISDVLTPDINIWIQYDLAFPPRMLAMTDKDWVTALQEYQDSFLQDRHGRFIAWIYVQVLDTGTPQTGPSEFTISQVTEGLSGDPFEVEVSSEDAKSSPAVCDESYEAFLPASAGKIVDVTSDVDQSISGSDPADGDTAQYLSFSSEESKKPSSASNIRPPPPTPEGIPSVPVSVTPKKSPQSATKSTTKASPTPSKLPGSTSTGSRARAQRSTPVSPKVPKTRADRTPAPPPKEVIPEVPPKTGPVCAPAPPPKGSSPKVPKTRPVRAPVPPLRRVSPKVPSPKRANPPKIASKPAQPAAKKSSLVKRIRRVSIVAGNLKRKVTEGLKSPLTLPKPAPPAEPREKSTILTVLASQAREGGVQNPDNLLPYTRLPDQEAFFRYCSGYLPAVDPTSRENVRSVRLRNCKLAVTPHQFCTAIRMLFAENNAGFAGGFLASAPGTGKTYIVLFLYAFRSLLFSNKREVEIEWAETDKRAAKGSKGGKNNHLPRHAPRGQRLQCPTQNKFGTMCYCVPDGLTRWTLEYLKPGVTTIHVPTGAMPSWLSAIKAAKFDPSVYNVAIFLPTVAMPDGLKNNLGVVDTLKRGIKVGATLPARHPGGRIQNQTELNWEIQSPPLTAKNHMALESYCFVTPHYSTSLENDFQYALNDLSPRPAKVTEFIDGKLYCLLVAMTFVDESDQVMSPDAKPMELARIHRHIRARETGSDIWHITATPFGDKFEDVMSAVILLAPQLTADVAALRKNYALAVSSDDAHIHGVFENQFRRVFNDQLVIRDSEAATFLGHPITDIQMVKPKFISSSTPESQKDSLQGFIDEDLRPRLTIKQNVGDAYVDYPGSLKTSTRVINALYFFSLFPSAAEVFLEEEFHEPLYHDFRLSEIIRSLPDTTGESIARCKILTNAVEKFAKGAKSPKVQNVLNEIQRMVRDSSERPDSNNEISKRYVGSANKADLTLKKMVIITPTIATAVFLYLYLIRYHNSYNPLLYHRDLKASAKADVVKKFESLKKEKNPFRIFIAPASVAGAGLNLQVANRLILTSPLLSTSDEKQALARVNRIGQTLPVDLKILISEDSPIDRIIIADRARRSIITDPFALDQDLTVVSQDIDLTIDSIGGEVGESEAAILASTGIFDGLPNQDELAAKVVSGEDQSLYAPSAATE